MSSSLKNAVIVAVLLALGAVGTLAWWQHRQLATLERLVALAEEDHRDAQARLGDAERRLAAAEKRRAELETERAEPRNRAGSERTRTNLSSVVTRAATSSLENPAVQRVLATGMRGSLDQRYGTLFRQLKLSPAELEKLKDLLTERQMSSLDVMTAARTQGVRPSEIPALMEKVQADMDQNIRQMLGDQRFERYQSFNQNFPSYSALEQIERRLSYTNAPLQPAQSDALLRVLIETAPPGPAEGSPARNMLGVVQSFGAAPMIAGISPIAISSQTIERAAGILHPAQTEVLRQLQSEQQSQTTMMQTIRVNAFGSDNSAANVAEVPGGTDSSTPAGMPPQR